jgi:Leucine-rich repeat (LRR) protein
LSWNYIETFDGMNLPSTLTELWLGGNLFESLAGVEFPSSLSLLYVHDLPLSSVMGVSFPASIKNLYESLARCRAATIASLSDLTTVEWPGPQEPAELQAHVARQCHVPVEPHQPVRLSWRLLQWCAPFLIPCPCRRQLSDVSDNEITSVPDGLPSNLNQL